MEYCIIIPTFNNEKTLEWVISEVLKITKDIFIVNDGSTDSTSVLLDKYNYLEIITYAPNRGKGYAIQKGFDAALKAASNGVTTWISFGKTQNLLTRIFLKQEHIGTKVLGGVI